MTYFYRLGRAIARPLASVMLSENIQHELANLSASALEELMERNRLGGRSADDPISGLVQRFKLCKQPNTKSDSGDDDLGEPPGFVKTSDGLAFSPSGHHIYAGGPGNAICVWDIETEQFVGDPWKFLPTPPLSFTVAPDGTKLATSMDSRENFGIWIWTVNSREAIQCQGHEGRITFLEISPDGQWLSSTSYDATTRLWDVHTGEAVGESLKEHSYGIAASAHFTPDGQKLVVALGEDKVGSYQIWDVSSSPFTLAVGPVHLTHSVETTRLSPDGRTLAFVTLHGQVIVYFPLGPSSLERAVLDNSSIAVAFPPDGRNLAIRAISDGSRYLQACKRSRPPGDSSNEYFEGIKFIKLVSGPFMGPNQFLSRGLAFSPTEQYVCTVSHDTGEFFVWDAMAGETGVDMSATAHWQRRFEEEEKEVLAANRPPADNISLDEELRNISAIPTSSREKRARDKFWSEQEGQGDSQTAHNPGSEVP
ncbi:tricorn protease domain 2-containing protein [Coniophora puteana RWD-64-598 SS2]|uniref:Tricorn protease domain 2-containing protein n=1 Tax=Coniophora puteana (strain RWD-64-598) TaxID=741705 RepID=A0A5M3MMU4_CONPW|nr:tricorn protease domain 2-containing protein [Coniophora puteana RWD-64-598 SS2]EIW79931.1 tricorn protease domain 2-containing protein [Coniophora puteana RWD-64-598 SS2]